MSIQGQLTENGHRLDKLRSDLRRYQAWLEEAEGKGGPGKELVCYVHLLHDLIEQDHQRAHCLAEQMVTGQVREGRVCQMTWRVCQDQQVTPA